MKLTVSEIKRIFKKLDFRKITDAAVATALNDAAVRTEDFSDDDLVEIEAENFEALFKIVEKRFPAAFEDSTTQPAAQEKKAAPAVTKKQKPVVKEKKKEADKPARKAEKPAPSVSSTDADGDALEWCRAAIQSTLQRKKNAKLQDWKKEKIAKLKEKEGIAAEEIEGEIQKINDTTFSEAFTRKKSITEDVSDSMLSIFDKILRTTAKHISASKELNGGQKVDKFISTSAGITSFFAQEILPKLHKKCLGDRSDRYITDFETKAASRAKEVRLRLEKKFESKNAA